MGCDADRRGARSTGGCDADRRVRGRPAGCESRAGRAGRGAAGSGRARTPRRPGARPPLRRRARGAVARPVHSAADVATALGARRPGPLPLHVQRERHDRGLRLGPRHRHASPGHRPAQRHLRCHRHPGRRRRLVVRRHRRRRVRPLEWPSRSRAASRRPRCPVSRTATPAGLDVGRSVVAAGTLDRRRHARSGCAAPTAAAAVIYASTEDAGVGGLSEDETLLAIRHSEHGDSRHPDVCVVRAADGSTVAEKSDGPGKGLTPLAFAPVAGDPRLLLAARAPRPRGAADLGRRRRHRDRDPPRPARRGGRRLVARRHALLVCARPRGPHPAVPLRPRRPAR